VPGDDSRDAIISATRVFIPEHPRAGRDSWRAPERMRFYRFLVENLEPTEGHGDTRSLTLR